MRAVNGEWTYLRPSFASILGNGVATAEEMKNIQELNIDLLNDLSLAVYLYAHQPNTCELASAIKENEWENALAEVGLQRLRTREALTLFYQAAKQIRVDESKVDAGTALSAADEALHTAIEGSYLSKIPSPPSQEVVDALYYALKSFKKFSTIVSDGLQETDIVGKVDMPRVERYTSEFMQKMDHVADMYVNASTVQKPYMRSVIIEIFLASTDKPPANVFVRFAGESEFQ
jgi:hypothetical protein